MEHIVVDDGSNDNTSQIVRQYADKHNWISFIFFPENRGTNAARNAAIEAAKGEWCVLLDSDDYFLPTAFVTIAKSMKSHPSYQHYMFAHDDMQPYYAQNQILKGCKEKALLYPDFLNGHIGGDFVHVCNTEILRRHPFNEQIRIYEGLFFLMFFREAQQMWFTNEVVTLRERNRSDSVSREVIRTKRVFIERSILHAELMLENFEEEMKTLHMLRRLSAIKARLLENLLLVSDYQKAKAILRSNDIIPNRKFKILILVYMLRSGFAYRYLLQAYLFIKYQVFHKRLA
ncbi:MAG: glycosyltransferase family 2 protein [Prevotellamassilia sp.]|nr:glycosyltransferase family 2 protein [Prevotellamassilia sp.]